jgi:transcriptional regulator with XRE-family HTH domain
MATDELRLLGRRIKELRKKRRLTQEQLAEKCHMHYKFLGSVERATVNPTLKILKKIAAALDVSLADLFRYEAYAGDPAQIRKRLIEDIKKCSDAEALLLYRIYRSL